MTTFQYITINLKLLYKCALKISTYGKKGELVTSKKLNLHRNTMDEDMIDSIS